VHVAELWRYPVKSMGGEPLQRAAVGPLGIEGDRLVQVFRPDGRVATARTFPGLLGHKGTLGPDGEPLVDGRPWRSPSVAADAAQIVGDGARLAFDDGPDRFDILPLLVATDGAIAAFGFDGRRLRPNIVVGGVPGLAERDWEGRFLRIGQVLIAIQDLRGRCVMTTYDPDTLEQNRDVLAGIISRFDGRLALNACVISGGELAVGDPVELLDDEPGPP
jgi:uncharacterized protein YcbX